jgi:DNA-binding winged helix-turn-helix (wHTH) protein
MGTQPSLASKAVFGPFEYEDVSGRLTKYGIPLRLQGKPLQILSLLVSRPGEIISREQLQRHLWGGTTFVDFEQGLNSAINKLRQALGDSADHPRYVETLPGRGYRFIAPIDRTSTKSVLEMAAPASLLRIEPKPSRHLQPWLLSVAVIALVVASGGAYWLARRSAEPVGGPRPARFAVVAPT